MFLLARDRGPTRSFSRRFRDLKWSSPSPSPAREDTGMPTVTCSHDRSRPGCAQAAINLNRADSPLSESRQEVTVTVRPGHGACIRTGTLPVRSIIHDRHYNLKTRRAFGHWQHPARGLSERGLGASGLMRRRGRRGALAWTHLGPRCMPGPGPAEDPAE